MKHIGLFFKMSDCRVNDSSPCTRCHWLFINLVLCTMLDHQTSPQVLYHESQVPNHHFNKLLISYNMAFSKPADRPFQTNLPGNLYDLKITDTPAAS